MGESKGGKVRRWTDVPLQLLTDHSRLHRSHTARDTGEWEGGDGERCGEGVPSLTCNICLYYV
jgi:hypothetical protein